MVNTMSGHEYFDELIDWVRQNNANLCSTLFHVSKTGLFVESGGL